jgi:uncharacterized protein YajQ (UPF0234 family)
LAEVQNAVLQARREIGTRFDFKGSGATVELAQKESTLTLVADNDQQLRSLVELMSQRLAKRGVSLRALDIQPPTPGPGGTRRQVIAIRQGVPAEKARQMQKLIRDSKLKVTTQIQDDQIRVFGAKKDDLQTVIALLRSQDFGMDLQFLNLR